MSNLYSLKGDIQRPTVKLAKMDTPLKIRWSRLLPGKVVSLTVSRDAAGRYFISFQCERHISPLPQKTNAVGLDLGLTHLVITSDSFKHGNPKFFSKLEAKLGRAQRFCLARSKTLVTGISSGSRWRVFTSASPMPAETFCTSSQPGSFGATASSVPKRSELKTC